MTTPAEHPAASVDCPACAEENGGWRCTRGEGCVVAEAFGPTDSEKRRQEARSAASTERREQGFREFKWWLGHPRLYRLIGFRWLCWRYRDLGVGIPDPRRAPQEAIDLGRELARKYGW